MVGEKTLSPPRFTAFVMSVIRDALNGTTPSCTKAEQIWDYLYSGDAGEAFYLLGEQGISGRTYVLGSGTARPLREYIDEICSACAGILGRERVNPAYGAKPYSEKQVMHLLADTGELTGDTGYKPGTSFAEGIRETIDWVRKNLR